MQNLGMRYVLRIAGLGLVAVLLFGFGRATTRVSAATDGVVEGDLVNKTAGGAVPANTPVELEVYKGMSPNENRAALTDSAGHFRFDKLETVQDFSYQVTAHYKGVSYFSDVISLTANPKPQPVQLDVYEPTTNFGEIHVERAHVIVEVTARSLQFAQLYVLTYPGDRTYVGPAENGSAPTLNFSLPAGATNLQFQQGALGERFQSTPDGFADTEPVLPGSGSLQIVYRYQVPFSSTALSLAITNAYTVTAMNVLISDPKVHFASPGLQNDGVRTVQNEQWQSFSAGNMPPRQAVQLNFESLPLDAAAAASTPSTALAAPATSANPSATSPDLSRMGPWVVFGLFMFVVGFGVGRFTPRLWGESLTANPTPMRRAASADGDDLIVALADLDDAFERGDLDEENYRRERAQLKKGRGTS
jgi:hypothetical protein